MRLNQAGKSLRTLKQAAKIGVHGHCTGKSCQPGKERVKPARLGIARKPKLVE